MVEVALKVKPNIVRETLNRMGVRVRVPKKFSNRYKNAIAPSVYLYHTEIDGVQKFFLIHFKEWFLLNHKNAYDNISQDDKDRLNYVAKLLYEWNLIDCDTSVLGVKPVKLVVVKKSESSDWFISHKIKF